MKTPAKRQTPTPGRLWAYVRAVATEQTASIDAQRRTVCERAQRMGRLIDGFFIDKSNSGDKPVQERVAGKRLFATTRPGDTILIAGLDSFSRSYLEFATSLENIRRRGVFLHVCDVPGGVFDPSNPLATVLTDILIAVAQSGRSWISIRTAEGLAEIREPRRAVLSTRFPRDAVGDAEGPSHRQEVRSHGRLREGAGNHAPRRRDARAGL